MSHTASVLLEFDPTLNRFSKGKELRDGLSVVVQVENTLWVTNDETISLERLSRQPDRPDGKLKYGEHQQFALHDYLDLPVPPPKDEERTKIEEADLEGLDYQAGYLWLVGSHSLKRGKPDSEASLEDNIKSLGKVKRDSNRFLLARIPVVEDTCSLAKEVKRDGQPLTAAQLRGDAHSNDLMDELANDKQLAPFLSIPGKDNGFDIEGLAVTDDGSKDGTRVFLGLRGPVLSGWALILELELEPIDKSTFKLKKIGRDQQHYRKHFLELGGLGIRDLCFQGSDLLILAGPTMKADYPVTIFRWWGGASPSGESLVFSKDPTLEKLSINQSEDHSDVKGDQAEGMTLFSVDERAKTSVLIVYDSAAESRHHGVSGLEVDVFDLPDSGPLI